MSSGPSTKERQIQEIIRAGRDPAYFTRKYAKIQHQKKGLIPFTLFQFQEDCMVDFVKHRLNVVVKARQLGMSTTVAAYAAWLALFHKHQNIMVIATKRSTAQNFIRKVKIIVKNVPKWMMLAQVVRDNQQEIEFSHGSSIKAVPTSADAGRSEALALLIIDEAAHIQNFDELWTGLYPTVSTGGKCIVLSTPKGVGGQFHKLYTDAELGQNDFNPICLPWSVHPERDEAWFDRECRQLGSQKKVSQELMCDFTTSGETFLSNDDIAWVRDAVAPPVDKWGLDHSLWVWEYPKTGHRYLISADVARGDSHDFSAFHVIDMDESSVVAEYKSRIPPDRFGDLLSETGLKYNKALLAPESNTYGYATLVRLRELNYPRVYKPDDRAAYVVDYSPIGEEPGKMGFSTQGHSRVRILTKLEETIRNKGVVVRSSRLHDELKTFVWQGGKAQSMSGRNDDLVMSLAIGLWLHDSSEGYSNRDIALSKCLLDGMTVSSHRINQVEGSGHDVATAWNPYAKHAAKSIPIHVGGGDSPARDPRFNHGDFEWVLK